jgi:hypothetical protein
MASIRGKFRGLHSSLYGLYKLPVYGTQIRFVTSPCTCELHSSALKVCLVRRLVNHAVLTAEAIYHGTN